MWLFGGGSGRVSVGPYVEHDWWGWRSGRSLVGGRADVAYRLADNDTVFAWAGAYRQDFARTAYRNGTLAEGGVMWTHALDASSFVSLGGGFRLEDTRRAYLDHEDYTASLGGYREWAGGWITYVEGTYEYHDYHGRYPGLGKAREDHLASVVARVSYRDLQLFGLTPRFEYRYTRQFSNVPFFDYASHDAGVTLTHEF